MLFTTISTIIYRSPQIRVVSISFSPFNNASSRDSNYILDWNVTLYIKKPNEDTIVTYEEIRAWLYHKDDLVSVGRMESLIFQGSNEQTLVPIRLTTYDQDGWLSKEIEGEFERNEVIFYLLLKFIFRINPNLRFDDSSRIVVECENLMLDSFNKTNGIMTGKGGNCTQKSSERAF